MHNSEALEAYRSGHDGPVIPSNPCPSSEFGTGPETEGHKRRCQYEKQNAWDFNLISPAVVG